MHTAPTGNAVKPAMEPEGMVFTSPGSLGSNPAPPTNNFNDLASPVTVALWSPANLTPLELAHFWSRVEGDTDLQCWPWRGSSSDRGYGRYRGTMAHRIAYELVNGPIQDGLIVRHTCDNPPCCNPSHLILGDNISNMQDALDRGRFAIGERHGNTKLNSDAVDYIRRNPDKLKGWQLAMAFDVAESTITYIRSGRSWKHSIGATAHEQA